MKKRKKKKRRRRKRKRKRCRRWEMENRKLPSSVQEGADNGEKTKAGRRGSMPAGLFAVCLLRPAGGAPQLGLGESGPAEPSPPRPVTLPSRQITMTTRYQGYFDYKPVYLRLQQ